MGAMAANTEKDFASAVEKIASGKWQDAIPLLAGILGTIAGGAVVGAFATGSAEFVARLIADSADKRIAQELHRLDTEAEHAEIVAAHVCRALEAVRHREGPALESLVRASLRELSEEGREQFVQVVRVLRELGAQLEVHGQSLTRIEAKQASHDEYLTLILRQLAEDKGVPVAPLRRILRRLGDADVPFEQIPERLSRKADEMLALREALRKFEVPELCGVRAQALARLEQGDLDGARRMLQDARPGRRARREQDAREESMLLSDEAKIDGLELRYREAAQKFAAAAEIVRFDDAARADYLVEQAEMLRSHGDEFAENDALRDAIDVYKAVLEIYTREHAPIAWAATLNNLAVVLCKLGERERGTERLFEAVASYRAALLERTRERVPFDWATTQTNLGVALQTLGSREPGTETLHEAVAAYRAALLECTRERLPGNWSTIQNNLGNALSVLAGRESGHASLAAAVAAYRAALLEVRRERSPLAWAATQNNLGNALRTLGARVSSREKLIEAVSAYRAALSEWTRERVPLDWAMAQNNLAIALRTLGTLEGGTEYLDEAVTAYRASLLEQTRERDPLAWARTQNNLGAALSALGVRESGIARLVEAAAAYRAALSVLTREQTPLDWAATQHNLGAMLHQLGEREGATARLYEAVEAFRLALLERTRARVPLAWASTQANLGTVLRTLGASDIGTTRLQQAIEAYREALSEYTEESTRFEWAMTQGNLATALQLLAARNDSHVARSEMLVDAAEAFGAALDVFEESLGDEHVLTRSARGSLRAVYAAIKLAAG